MHFDRWSDILSSVTWDICSTRHNTVKASPTQLVFNQIMLLSIKYVAEWKAIGLKKWTDTDISNHRVKCFQVEHNYQVWDKVFVADNDIHKKLKCPSRGPYNIVYINIHKYTLIYTCNTVSVSKGAVTERLNTKYCTPYMESHDMGEHNKLNKFWLAKFLSFGFLIAALEKGRDLIWVTQIDNFKIKIIHSLNK